MAEMTPTDKPTPTPMTPTTPPNPPALPGADKPGGTLPYTQQGGPRGQVPASWEEAVRFMRTMLDIYEANKVKAQELAKIAREELEKQQ
jgi:hypothetical protein